MSATQFIVTRLGNQRYGIPISDVHQIIRYVDPTPIPGMRGNITGIINLRGHVLPVVDIRSVFGIPANAPSRDTRIVVINLQNHEFGLYVDAVTEVLAIDDELLETPENLILDFEATYLDGIARLEDGLILLPNLDAVLNLREISSDASATVA